MKATESFQNSPFSQHTPLYPYLQWQLKRTSVPPFRQNRLHALALCVVTTQVPPHCAGLMIGRREYCAPCGPHECEQAPQGDHEPGTQLVLRQDVRRRPHDIRSLGSEAISLTKQTKTSTVSFSHPIARST